MATITINELSGGMNQSTTPDLIDKNQSTFLLNCTLDNIGSIAHRLGDNLIGDSDTSTNTGVSQGGAVYNQSDGTSTLLRVNGGALESYNVGTDDWDEEDAALVNSASTVEFSNFLNNIYMIGSGSTEYLKYFNGSSVLSVSGSIPGQYLAAGSRRLAVARDPNNLQRIYYSEIPAATTISFDLDNNYVDLDDPATGIASLGEAAPFLGFTKEDMFVLDLNTASSRKLAGFGCTSHRSIKVLHGSAIWLNNEGIWRFAGVESYPMKISTPLENWFQRNAVFNELRKTNFDNAAAGVWRNKYFLSVGDLANTVEGYTLNDCYFVYDISKNTWTLETHTAGGPGAWFDKWVDGNNQEILTSGSRDNRRVYHIHRTNLFTDDDSSGTANNVTAVVRTKHFEFGGSGSKYAGPESSKQVDKGFFKTYAALPLDLNYNIDYSDSYTDWVTLSATASGYNWNREEAEPFGNNDFHSLSLEFVGSGEWVLYEYGFNMTAQTFSKTGYV